MSFSFPVDATASSNSPSSLKAMTMFLIQNGGSYYADTTDPKEKAKVDMEAVNKDEDQEEGQVFVDLEYNQNINSVKSYYENLGLKCTK